MQKNVVLKVLILIDQQLQQINQNRLIYMMNTMMKMKFIQLMNLMNRKMMIQMQVLDYH